MKTLIVDYFRRKALFLVLGAATQIIFGAVAASPHGLRWQDVGFQLQFATLLMGPVLLSYDLGRGVARVFGSLPLTARQVGRALWLATVGIPTLASAVLLCVGAAGRWLFAAGGTFPADRIAIMVGLTLLWQGGAFAIIFAIGTRGPGGGIWLRTSQLLLGALWGLMLGGSSLLFPYLQGKPGVIAVMASCWAVAALIGWVCAGNLFRMRAVSRAVQIRKRPTRSRTYSVHGAGGLLLLIRTTCVRGLYLTLAMFSATLLLQVISGADVRSWNADTALRVITSAANFSPAWLLITFSQVVPAVQQLRYLRSLPISPSRLAVTLLAIQVIPLAIGAVVLAGAMDLCGIPAAARAILTSYGGALPAAAFSVYLIVWKGFGRYALVALIAVGFTLQGFVGAMLFSGPSLPWVILAAVASVAAAYFLMRRELLNGSNPYRTNVSPFGYPAWGR